MRKGIPMLQTQTFDGYQRIALTERVNQFLASLPQGASADCDFYVTSLYEVPFYVAVVYYQTSTPATTPESEPQHQIRLEEEKAQVEQSRG
jgi:hypothetical protein